MKVRFRLAHTKTQVRGWQHETTVEVEGEVDFLAETIDGHDIQQVLGELTSMADGTGRLESQLRNERDDRERTDG